MNHLNRGGFFTFSNFNLIFCIIFNLSIFLYEIYFML